jgi:hypothetical protein
MDAQGNPTDDPEQGFYGRLARAQFEAVGVSDPFDIPPGLQRCQHCNKPGAERWDWHGRAVYLHEGCQHPWADNGSGCAWPGST